MVATSFFFSKAIFNLKKKICYFCGKSKPENLAIHCVPISIKSLFWKYCNLSVLPNYIFVPQQCSSSNKSRSLFYMTSPFQLHVIIIAVPKRKQLTISVYKKTPFSCQANKTQTRNICHDDTVYNSV